ncbi:MAG TPA: YdeI/OmpD-associated family protein [Candidatus Dormibacteraeota bacterium]
MRFRTKILQAGKTATGIEVPSNVMEGLGAGKKPPVRVTIKGYTYRSTVATVNGKPMVGVSEEVRKNAGVTGGDTVDVDMELDTAPREVEVPADLATALARDAKANRFFEGLSYSNKRRFTIPISEAKSAETRQRRIKKTIETLRSGRI